MPKYKIAYLLSHPIQYQVPMIRYLNQVPDIYVKVFYSSDLSLREYYDDGFGKKVEWDVPLLGGYDHEFLPALGSKDQLTFFKPFNYGLMQRLKQGGFDALWLHGYSRFINLQAIVYAKIAGLKVFIRDEAWEKSQKRSWKNKLIKRLWFNVLKRFTDAFLAIGTCNRDYYLANNIGENSIFLVPYVVDNEFFAQKSASADTDSLRKEHVIGQEQKVVLYASKLSERKRVLDLIQAFASLVCQEDFSLQRPFLLIVGAGELEFAAKDLINRLGLTDCAKIVGFKNQSDLPAYYALCDVFVLPSANEPWGLAVNEAMSCNAAIVASDQVGAAHDLVKDGLNGCIFETGNIRHLSEKLSHALHNSGNLGRKSSEILVNWGFAQVADGLKRAITYSAR